MRVIAGIKRGLKLSDFDGRDIRPTTDRVRENIFNIISPYVMDADVLDMFAGTGAFSIEALSRGANSAVLCELSETCSRITRQNIKKADFEDVCSIEIGNSLNFISKTDKTFDIIFLDPPYNTGLICEALSKLAVVPILNEGGIIVAECDDTEVPATVSGLSLIKEKKYGRTHILIYNKES